MFLNNHREVTAAFDFFTVPTLTSQVLYGFFVIEHSRRKILHFHATAHPTSEWIVQQLREAFSLPCLYRYVIFDHDAKFSSPIREFLTSSGIKPIQTSIYSPWQNGIAERWVGSCRRELLDHVIPLNEEHLRRLGREFLAYYHEDRTHNGLGKKTPADREIEARQSLKSELLTMCLESAAFITGIPGQKQPNGYSKPSCSAIVMGRLERHSRSHRFTW